jgi:hypothetical protein
VEITGKYPCKMDSMKKEIRLACGGAYLLVIFASFQLKKRA